MEATPSQTYDMRALVTYDKFTASSNGERERRTLIIRPNGKHALTFHSEQPTTRDYELRSDIETKKGVNMPPLRTIRYFGALAAERTYGYAFRPDCLKEVPKREFSYRVNELDELLDAVHAKPDNYDPSDAELIRRYYEYQQSLRMTQAG